MVSSMYYHPVVVLPVAYSYKIYKIYIIILMRVGLRILLHLFLFRARQRFDDRIKYSSQNNQAD
jgi:hypothetical protein